MPDTFLEESNAVSLVEMGNISSGQIENNVKSEKQLLTWILWENNRKTAESWKG